MRTSAKYHIYFQFLKLTLLIVVTFIILIRLIFDDIESNMLATELKNETAHYVSLLNAEAKTWETASAISTFIPKNVKIYSKLPLLFKGLPVPFSGEVEVNAKQYWVVIQKLSSGVLYIAKDISLFEDREDLFNSWLVFLALIFIMLGWVIAWLSAKRIFTPLNKLAEEIAGINPEEHSRRVSEGQRDWELKSIAIRFNLYLDSMESYIRREKALVGMASHELRTPVAIISGALDVLEERGSLSEKDHKTISRIRIATTEMQANVKAILIIARNKDSDKSFETVLISEVFQSVTQELIDEQTEYTNRINLISSSYDHKVYCVKALVKILVKNLIQNSLQHTKESVILQQHQKGIIVSDAGCGLPEFAVKQLASELGHTDKNSVPGLGLFIVTLICEHLNWCISIENKGHGTSVSISLV